MATSRDDSERIFWDTIQISGPWFTTLSAKADLSDFEGLVEEDVIAAAYDEEVKEIMRRAISTETPDLGLDQYWKLQEHLENEYNLFGRSLARALAKCARNIKENRVLDGEA